MKNKEIEELLDELKEVTNSKKLSSTYCITNKHWQLLLSYIEQLEKENKILKENAEHNDKVVDKVNWENKQLENNRDKAIELLNIGITTYNNGGSRTALFGVIEDSRDILKGDSDE